MRFRDLFKDILIYGTGDIFLKATAFITLPVYTRIFTPEDYGIWSFVATAMALLGSVLILGGDSAYIRFFFEAKTFRDRQTITSTWFGFLALWSVSMTLLCLPFAWVFSCWSFGTGQYRALYLLGLLAAPVTLINTMCGHVLRNQFRARLFTILNILSTTMSVGLSILGALVLDLALVGVFGGALLAAFVMLPIRIWTARDLLCPIFSVQVLRNLLAFGLPLVPTSLAYWIFVSSDRIILGKLSTLDVVGLYSVAASAVGLLGLMNSALGLAWSPHAVRLYEEQPEAAPMLFGQVMTYVLTGFGLLCVGITAFADELLIILSTPEFYPAALAVGPLALGFIAYASTQITATGISLSKKTKYFAIYSWAAALLNVTLNVLFVPVWGMMAASWATAVSYVFLTLAYLITSQRLKPVAYEKRRALTVIVLTVFFTIAVPFLPKFSLIMNIIAKSAYFFVFLALILLLRVLDRRELVGALEAVRGIRISRTVETV